MDGSCRAILHGPQCAHPPMLLLCTLASAVQRAESGWSGGTRRFGSSAANTKKEGDIRHVDLQLVRTSAAAPRGGSTGGAPSAGGAAAAGSMGQAHALAPHSRSPTALQASAAASVVKITCLPDSVLAKCLGFLDLKQRCAPRAGRVPDVGGISCTIVGSALRSRCTRGTPLPPSPLLPCAKHLACFPGLLQAGPCFAHLQTLRGSSPQP